MIKNGKLQKGDWIIDNTVSINDGYGLITNIRLEHADSHFETFIDVDFEDCDTGKWLQSTYTIKEIFNHLT